VRSGLGAGSGKSSPRDCPGYSGDWYCASDVRRVIGILKEDAEAE
jgi:hypothetical protein